MNISINELLGKTIINITGANNGSDEIIFKCSDGSTYKMYHEQDCCEHVEIIDVCGNITNLLNTPITLALEKACDGSNDNDDYYESKTWTFYTLATINGFVDIRWLGESNGYYSESVDFIKVGDNNAR